MSESEDGEVTRVTQTTKGCAKCGHRMERRKSARRDYLKCVECAHTEPTPTYFTLVRERAPLLPGMEKL